jgi:hypothetical protein
MRMRARLTLLDDMLGTCSANPDIHREFIASKSRDADKMQEEIDALPADTLMQKAVTVFARDPDGMPALWDYQFKGFLKEATGVLIELDMADIRIGKTRLSKFTYKRIIDNYVFVTPRQIPLVPVSGVCTRPIRVDTMRGERVSLASSEVIPAGTSFDVDIDTLSPALDLLVRKCLNYGKLKGLGQWRNSGKGRFTWEEVLHAVAEISSAEPCQGEACQGKA